ncbi:MAG: DUF1553 domain-containing protein [Planctomycetaceae bacterium]|nr:DUF1553 domain-containing protein [Planctomycetaceae bacterium]
MTIRYSKKYTLLSLVIAGISYCATSGFADEISPAGLEFFEKKIRPVLVSHCYECHSQESKNLKGSLLLDSKAGLLKGGDSGAAIVAHKPEQSLLLETLHYGDDTSQMPPKGKLPAQIIKNFELWIQMGAPDPRTEVNQPAEKIAIDFEARRKFWSFQLPQAKVAPAVTEQQWVKNPIDAFILAKLEAQGLEHADAAQKNELIRRATFDLTGLPATREEVSNYLQDDSADAFATVVSRLLNSPHYGEHWGRHWLDVARYAEDNTNMGPHNGPFPNAYRYRDWVVQAINDDVPYNEFIIRQLATDFLTETGPEDYPALGYMGLGPSYHKEVALAQVVLENRYADDWEDRVDSLCRGLLGLTMACARCHDHKYDPLTTKDYYRIAGVFASVRQTTRPVISDEEVAKTQPARDKVKAIEEANKKLTTQISATAKQLKELNTQQKKQVADKKTEEATTPKSEQKPNELSTQIEQTKTNIEKKKKNTAQWKKQVEQNKAAIALIKKETPGFVLPVADALTEEQIRVEEITKEKMKIAYYPDKPRNLNVFIRGDAGNLGSLVPRGYIEILSGDAPIQFQQGSGRLELAKLIASDKNPLTARVMVNRIWMQHFGTGLVSTPSNFGEAGAKPSHPQLLDDLAVRFMKNGWSMKWLHREIMHSATYQQSSQNKNSIDKQTIDPNNRLLSHFNRRRLSAEAFRDSLLAVSNQLDRTMAGPSGNVDDAKFSRRAIYSKVSRHELSIFLQAYDFPDPAIHAAQRTSTTTPLQQLFVMNSEFLQNQAMTFASQYAKLPMTEKIDTVYETLFSRKPTDAERLIATSYLQKTNQSEQLDSPKTPAVAPTFSGKRIRTEVKDLGAVYSVEIWIRNTMPNNKRPITGYFFSRGLDNLKTDSGDHLGISGTHKNGPAGRLLFFNGAKQQQSFTGKTTIQPNTWNHVVFVRKEDTIELYLNGNPTPEISAKANIGYEMDTSLAFLGGRNDNFANFEGQIDAVSIYNRELRTEEFSAHYKSANAGPDTFNVSAYRNAVLSSKPTSLWVLSNDNPQSSLATDSSSNNFHGSYEERSNKKMLLSTRWQKYCHALLSSNEMIFID